MYWLEITGCSSEYTWYKDHVGSKFKVDTVGLSNGEYLFVYLALDIGVRGTIHKSDCVLTLIKEEEV